MAVEKKKKIHQLVRMGRIVGKGLGDDHTRLFLGTVVGRVSER